MKINKAFSAIVFAATAALSGAVQAIPSLSFIIDGDTFGNPYRITNNSTGSESVTRFILNLGTISAGGPFCFDTVFQGPCNPNTSQLAMAFAPVGSSGLDTGMVAPVIVGDGANLLDISFTNFTVGKTFTWNIDVDSSSAISVFGNNLIGATAFVDFSDGQRLIGSLVGIAGNPDASQFTVTGIVQTPVPEPATLALMGLGLAGLGWARRKRAAK